MNIFTAIKYPIDITFRVQDLERIPTHILEQWWEWSTKYLTQGDNRARIPAHPDRIHAYLNNSTRRYIREIMLRRLRQDLDNWDNSRT